MSRRDRNPILCSTHVTSEHLFLIHPIFDNPHISSFIILGNNCLKCNYHPMDSHVCLVVGRSVGSLVSHNFLRGQSIYTSMLLSAHNEKNKDNFGK